MKAWELTRDLLRDTKPVVRTAENRLGMQAPS